MPALRFVFPHAPVRPVTINNGYQMRAWYDIIGIDRRSAEDFAGIAASADAIGGLIKRENARGIASAAHRARRFLARRRHGAAHRARGIPKNSPASSPCPAIYRWSSELATARTPPTRRRPFSWRMARRIRSCPTRSATNRAGCWRAAGYSVEWHAYPMPHGLCEPEVAHLRSWLKRVCEA